MSRTYRALVPIAVLQTFVLALTACGSDSATDTSTEATEVQAEPDASVAGSEDTVTDETQSGELASLADDIVTQLDTFLQSQVYIEGDISGTTAPGLVLLVDTPDGQYLQAAGVASLEEPTAVSVDDRFEIGSNTKSFVTAMLLQLQEEGTLSMDDMLSDWLPEQADAIPNGDQVTLLQLAQHTSGIWDYGDPLLEESVLDPDMLVQGFTPEEIVQYAIDNGTPEFTPGEDGQWSYSNTGYVLLGEVVEAAAGDSLGNLLQERIFDPLNMESAALIPGVPESGEIINGYYSADDGTMLDTTSWNASQAWAAGAIAMNAEDLLVYAKALSAGELFEDPDSLTQMLTFDPNGLDGVLPYGLGVIDFGGLPGAEGFWGHEGQTPGFQTLWFTNPATGTTIIGFSNSGSYEAFAFAEVPSLLTPGE